MGGTLSGMKSDCDKSKISGRDCLTVVFENVFITCRNKHKENN